MTVRRACATTSIVDQFVTGARRQLLLRPRAGRLHHLDRGSRRAASAQGRHADAGGIPGHYKTEWRITEDYFQAWDHDPRGSPRRCWSTPTACPCRGSTPTAKTRGYGMTGHQLPARSGRRAAAAGGVHRHGLRRHQRRRRLQRRRHRPAERHRLRRRQSQRRARRRRSDRHDRRHGQYTLTVPVTQARGDERRRRCGRRRGLAPTTPGTDDSKPTGSSRSSSQPGDDVGDVDFCIKPPAQQHRRRRRNQPGILLGVGVRGRQRQWRPRQRPRRAASRHHRVHRRQQQRRRSTPATRRPTTNEHGAFVFTNVAAGQRILRFASSSPPVQTRLRLNNGAAHRAALAGVEHDFEHQFGVQNTAIFDYGDLPAIYGVRRTRRRHGARHKKGVYWLGARDRRRAERQSRAPTPTATTCWLPTTKTASPSARSCAGTHGAADRSTASRNNGYLQGWVDWNNDGDFNDVGERILTNRLLNAGDQQLDVRRAGVDATSPGVRPVPLRRVSRRRPNIDTPFGAADRRSRGLSPDVPSPSPPLVTGIPADSDQDGDVDGNDFLPGSATWAAPPAPRRRKATPTATAEVDGADLTEWKQDFGTTADSALVPRRATSTATATSTAPTSSRCSAVRRRPASHGAGDGNGDRAVNASDVRIW